MFDYMENTRSLWLMLFSPLLCFLSFAHWLLQVMSVCLMWRKWGLLHLLLLVLCINLTGTYCI